jgi:hypothetical protein
VEVRGVAVGGKRDLTRAEEEHLTEARRHGRGASVLYVKVISYIWSFVPFFVKNIFAYCNKSKILLIFYWSIVKYG